MTYEIGSNRIIISEGVYFKKRKHICLEDLKTYSQTQTYLQIALGVMDLTLTIVDGRSKFVLKGLPVCDVVDVLRQRINIARSGVKVEEPKFQLAKNISILAMK
ncbi:PH domain-containing protein [Mucilaginibacter sp. JRF]|uniref:PH domain-containing protein n=1 Tax=Mucilaginibacter sp. JRF TaxID=2780088 RepID=UPI003221FF9F